MIKTSGDKPKSANGQAVILKDRAPALANYPHARRFNGLIYISGVSSRQVDGSYKGVEESSDGTLKLDIEKQTQGVIENIKAILEHCHANLSHVIDLTVFLVNMDDYKLFNETYNKYFKDAKHGPSRTTVAVHQLPSPKLLIEIKAVAVDPGVQSHKLLA